LVDEAKDDYAIAVKGERAEIAVNVLAETGSV
jgi:hypothetical protein